MDPYELKSVTIDGGGGVSADSRYQVTATLGQADTTVMAGSGFRVAAGFWPQQTQPTDEMFSDSFE